MEGPNNSKGEHYNLRWNNYSNNLIQVFSEHKNNEKLVDVTLICEEQYIKAHKLVLSACSGFFQEMFRRQGGICGSVVHPFVFLNGVKYSHLKHILDFIYQGEIKVLDSDLEAILELGEKFQVRGLSSVKLKPKLQNDRVPTPTVRPEIPVQPPTKVTSFTQTATAETSKHEIPVFKKVMKEKFDKTDRSLYEIEPPRKRVRAVEPMVKALEKANQVHQIIDPIFQETPTTRKESPNIIGKEDKRDPVVGKVVLLSKTKDNASNNEKTTEPQKREMILERPDTRKGNSSPKSNPFMIFTNEWRKKLAVEHPNENNKEISIRLGTLWKNLSAETKQTYYKAARKAELETIYPGHVDNTLLPAKNLNRRKSMDSISLSNTETDNTDEVQIIDYSSCSHSEGSTNSN